MLITTVKQRKNTCKIKSFTSKNTSVKHFENKKKAVFLLKTVYVFSTYCHAICYNTEMIINCYA